jgi:hypothetical protein
MSHRHHSIYGHSSLLRRRYIFPSASPALIGIWDFSFRDPFRLLSRLRMSGTAALSAKNSFYADDDDACGDPTSSSRLVFSSSAFRRPASRDGCPSCANLRMALAGSLDAVFESGVIERSSRNSSARYSHKRSGRAGASAGGAAPPNILVSRPVDQAGRKSETTLRIAGLHFEIGTFPGATPDQFELPSGASNAGNRQRG